MRRCAVTIVLSVQALSSTELFSWHTFDTRLVSKGRFELNLHHRTRTRHELHYLDQSRWGTTGRFDVTKRFAFLGGYYFQPQQLHDDLWTKGNRLFAGFETPLLSKERHTVSFRFLSERHLNTGRPAYFRHRTSVRWMLGRGRVRPFVQNELLAAWPGFHSTRNSGGFSMKLSSEFSLEVSYLYDVRRTFWGGDRQSIVTAVRWTPKSLWGPRR